jgi:hypothetical protein
MLNYCNDTDTDGAGSPEPADHLVEKAPSHILIHKKLAKLTLDYGVDLDMTPEDLDMDQKSVQQEYCSYISQQISSKGTDILKFWEVVGCGACEQSLMGHRQVNHSAFPTLFAMAMDYLPVQASSVPCERVFSSSAETNTKQQNCISPVLMEVLQMLKFSLKKECLNFMSAWMVDQKEMSVDNPDSDILGDFLRSKGDSGCEDLQDKIIQFMDKYEE